MVSPTSHRCLIWRLKLTARDQAPHLAPPHLHQTCFTCTIIFNVVDLGNAIFFFPKAQTLVAFFFVLCPPPSLSLPLSHQSFRFPFKPYLESEHLSPLPGLSPWYKHPHPFASIISRAHDLFNLPLPSVPSKCPPHSS